MKGALVLVAVLAVSFVSFQFPVAKLAKADPPVNLVTNGDFTAGAEGWARSNVNGGDLAGGWFGSAGYVGPWFHPEGNPGGSFVLNEGGGCSIDPTISQQIDGLLPGAEYVVSGDYTSGAYYDRPLHGLSFGVAIDGTLLGEWPSIPSRAWTPFSASFIATADTVTLQLSGERNCGDNDIAVDNVAVVAVAVGPSVDLLGDITREATGADGAVVAFLSPRSHDPVDGEGNSTCLPSSGTTFPLGTTMVTCSATDSQGLTGSSSFNIMVVDTTPPVVTCSHPAPLYTQNAEGAIVRPSCEAQDVVDGDLSGGVFCDPRGPGFAPGDTVVTCSVGDDHRNVGGTSFTISVVVDQTPPAVSITSPVAGTIYVNDQPHSLPASLLRTSIVVGTKTLEASAADIGSGVESVIFAVDGVPLAHPTQAPYSAVWETGSWSGGNHIVSACAVDRAGNSACDSVVVKVVPTTPDGLVKTLL